MYKQIQIKGYAKGILITQNSSSASLEYMCKHLNWDGLEKNINRAPLNMLQKMLQQIAIFNAKLWLASNRIKIKVITDHLKCEIKITNKIEYANEYLLIIINIDQAQWITLSTKRGKFCVGFSFNPYLFHS